MTTQIFVYICVNQLSDMITTIICNESRTKESFKKDYS